MGEIALKIVLSAGTVSMCVGLALAAIFNPFQPGLGTIGFHIFMAGGIVTCLFGMLASIWTTRGQ